MRIMLAMLSAATVMAAGGCWGGLRQAPDTGGPGPLNAAYMKPAEMSQGIIYILPGIQGVDYHYLNIRAGLKGSGIKCAIKIHPWGCHIPGIGLAVNETDTRDDRAWGRTIAEEIAAYQRQYPGRPVYIIGQSGGSAVAVFAAEALADRAAPIEGLILLDASISADYDLGAALGQCNKGIVNFYNLRDVAMLEVGTEIFGNLDGGHDDSAGRTGFSGTFPKLYQAEVRQDMVSALAAPHFADTSAAFTSRYIVPWVTEQTWPVSWAAGRR